MGGLLAVESASTELGRAMLKERYRALQRQVPLLYSVALTNFIGLQLATGGTITDPSDPANLLVVLIVARMAHWLWHRGRELPPERIVGELRKTQLLAALISLGFCMWSIALYGQVGIEQQNQVVLFASLAAVGCAYGLISFPAAARMPLLLYALPFAFRLVVSSEPAHIAVGVSLSLIAFLILRLMAIQARAWAELLRSRIEIDAERRRAQAAEQAALAEKARVRIVADTDPLTGLANRRAFLALLEERLASGCREGAFVLALIDLDGFKPINDTFGHAAGDAVLTEVAARLAAIGGEAARMGGDEFALIVRCDDETEALRVGRRIVAALRRPYRSGEREFRLSACCGLALLRPGHCTAPAALARGDAALYRGKQSGAGAVALFTPALEQANRRRTGIERALRCPKAQDRIRLVFQPIFDLSSGSLSGFEALARWTHDELGEISPAEFIPITEHVHVVEQIGERLLAKAAMEAMQWPAAVALSFNLSALQLCSAKAGPRLLRILDRAGLDPARVRFEVTETALLADFEAARRNLARLRKAGCRIVLDDFGAGFASISYLREMNFDAIKLDGALVTGAAASPTAMRLLKGVLDLSAAMALPCVAEHLENEDQVALLRGLGCRYGQGYALAPPLEPEAARELAGSRLLAFPGSKVRRRPRRAA